MLYNIFNEFLEDYQRRRLAERSHRLPGQPDLAEAVSTSSATPPPGSSTSWRSYNGCILADSVGLGKTFTALARHQVLRAAQSLRPRALPQEAGRQLAELQPQPQDQHLREGPLQLRRPVPHRLAARPAANPSASRSTASTGATTISSSSTSPTTSATTTPSKIAKPATRSLMNSVIKDGRQDQSLMLSATPVNNRFTDLRNQLALAYEGDSEALGQKLKSSRKTSTRSSAERRQHSTPGRRFRRKSGRLQPFSKRSTSISSSCSTPSPSRAPQAHRDLLRHQGHRHAFPTA